MRKSDRNEMLAALRRVNDEADQLYELAAKSNPRLAMAIAHRLSSSVVGIRLVIEASTEAVFNNATSATRPREGSQHLNVLVSRPDA